MKMLLAIYLLILLAYASVTEAVPEASCVDTIGPIPSTKGPKTKYCSVIQSKLNAANNDNNEADFNKVKKRNCGPGPADWQWDYFRSNCTCTCAMEFTGPTDNPTPAPTTLSPTASPTPSPTASPTASFTATCPLSESPQWQHEEGYWIGEYSFYGADGNPSVSTSWNYRYDHYKGFITGNVQGGSYRQRNVFMYPPQTNATCVLDASVQGLGTCGMHGNMKVFEADQTALTCDPHRPGYIEGPYGSLAHTTTELVGRDNALVYQVWLTKAALNYYEAVVLGNPYGRCDEGYCGYTEDRLMQSQLTTLTQLPDGSWRRTRTAQGFDAFGNVGMPTYASYYRERKVSSEEFWTAFNATRAAYGILESDTCAWSSGETGGTVPSGWSPGYASCVAHLDESFELSS